MMQSEFLEKYWRWMKDCQDEKGFPIGYGQILGADGKIDVLALAVPPDEAYLHVLHAAAKMQNEEGEPEEIVFTLDRYAKPGQGTRYADLLAGHHFKKGQGWRPFIIEYQWNPRRFDPIDWGNTYWTSALNHEFVQSAMELAGMYAKARRSAK